MNTKGPTGWKRGLLLALLQGGLLLSLGEQLWVEVTLPAQGPPRPIRLGVRRGEGPITPLELR
ncbi:MAG: hypothetical protein QUV07_01365 [Cyanobium sp. CZS 25K]|nr:hypothetical protein [Cyanobium sp. CZS25K]